MTPGYRGANKQVNIPLGEIDQQADTRWEEGNALMHNSSFPGTKILPAEKFSAIRGIKIKDLGIMWRRR